jgi:hypothetical protein
MNQLYTNQSFTEIRLDTMNDLTGATDLKILFKKPNGQEGHWVATATGTELIYLVQNGDLDIPGLWKIQAYFQKQGKNAYGDFVRVTVLKSINNS